MKAAVEEELEERREALEESLDEKIRKLQERQELLQERIEKNAERLLLQNPGGKFMSRRIDSTETRAHLLELREKLKNKKS